jgi:hypothetical protein
MATVSATLSAVGASSILTVKPGQSITYSGTAATFVGIGYFERSRNQGAGWATVASATDTDIASGTIKNESGHDEWYRFRVAQKDALTAVSGSLAVSVGDNDDTILQYLDADNNVLLKLTEGGVETMKRTRKLMVNAAGKAKVGGTAGWVVAAADNVSLVTCPASQTAAKLVVPVHSLKAGDTITGFYLVGQIEGTSGNTVTVDADLRKHTAAAADVSDASVGAITQLSVTADTIMSSANTRKASLSEVIGLDETFYVLITATTGASTDIALQGIVLEITEA